MWSKAIMHVIAMLKGTPLGCYWENPSKKGGDQSHKSCPMGRQTHI